MQYHFPFHQRSGRCSAASYKTQGTYLFCILHFIQALLCPEGKNFQSFILIFLELLYFDCPQNEFDFTSTKSLSCVGGGTKRQEK